MTGGQLILSKIIKIVATSCRIFRLKCTKFYFGWGSAPDPVGELTALLRPLAGFKGPTSKMKRWKDKGGEEERGKRCVKEKGDEEGERGEKEGEW